MKMGGKFLKKKLKVSGIDKDFVNIINYLNEEGLKPFASCDGVVANHNEDNVPISAYIAFLNSPRIIDLLAAFLRDKETFTVTVSNHTASKPYYLYNNLIYGNHFGVSFFNYTGNVTAYFEKIITKVMDGNIKITNDEKRNISRLSSILEKNKKSALNFSVDFNTQYQPSMGKQGKINSLRVSTKSGYETRDVSGLIDMLPEEYGMVRNNMYCEDEFAVCPDKFECVVYFKDENTDLILGMIKHIRRIERDLPIREVKEASYNRYYCRDDYETPTDSDDDFII